MKTITIHFNTTLIRQTPMIPCLFSLAFLAFSCHAETPDERANLLSRLPPPLNNSSRNGYFSSFQTLDQESIMPTLQDLRNEGVIPIWNGRLWVDKTDVALSHCSIDEIGKQALVDINYWEGISEKNRSFFEGNFVDISKEDILALANCHRVLRDKGYSAQFDDALCCWKLVAAQNVILPSMSELKASRISGVANRLIDAKKMLKTHVDNNNKDSMPAMFLIRELGFGISAENKDSDWWPDERAEMLSFLSCFSPNQLTTLFETMTGDDSRVKAAKNILAKCAVLGCIPVWSGEQWNDGAVRFESLSGLDDDDRRLLLVLNYRLNPYYGRVWKSVLGDKDPLYGTTKEQIAARFRGKGYNLIREKNSGFLSLTPIEHTAP